MQAGKSQEIKSEAVTNFAKLEEAARQLAAKPHAGVPANLDPFSERWQQQWRR